MTPEVRLSRDSGTAYACPRRNHLLAGPPEVAPVISGGVELLNATFSASDGETVVVGTSRVRGSQQALVLLVTLVRSGTGNN